MRKILFVLLSAFCLHATAQQVDATLLRIVRENAKTVKTGKVKKAAGQKKGVQPVTVVDRRTGEKTVLDFKHEVNGVDTMQLKEMYELSFNADGSIRNCTVIGTLRDGATVPAKLLEELGVRVDAVIDQHVIMTVPAESLEKLDTFSEFTLIKGSRINHLLNDNSRKVTSTDFVTGESTASWGGINERYDGTGVVVGVIDTGIDFNHAAFLDPETGQTRIKMAGHFDSSGIQKITDTEEIKKLTTFDTGNSHGSHTSCTAAGSNVGGLGLQGMAPKADLVLFDLGNNLSDSRLVQAAEAIFDYAASVGKPAVINMSLGSNLGFHDGSGVTKLLAGLTDEGKILCVSAGNEATSKMSVRKKFESAEDNTLRTVICSNSLTGDEKRVAHPHGISTIIYANDNREFNVEMKVVDVQTGELYPIETSIVSSNNKETHPFTSGQYESKINEEANKSLVEIRHGQAFEYVQENTNLALALLIQGQEGQTITVIDDYAHRDYDYLAGANSFPGLTGYTDGDDKVSINIIACDDNIISVGSFLQRRAFHNSITGKDYAAKDTYTKEIAFYSSYGVDDNGKARPDVLSPGMWTISAYNVYDKNFFTDMKQPGKPSTEITNIVEGSQRPYPYGAMTGTSMACPAAAGIVALWLQANPNLTPAKVREIMHQTALNDKWTTITDNVPSGDLVQAGCGKINALRGIKVIENEKTSEPLYPLNETITIANGITTFSSMQPLDFSASTAPKAYVATDYTDGVLNFLRVEQCIPSQTGLLLVGEGEYTVPIVPTTSVGGSNLLVSTAEAAVTLSNEGEVYVLSRQNGVVGFYQNAAGLVVPQGKAYLTLPSGTTQQAKAIGYVFSEDSNNAMDEAYENIELKPLWNPEVVIDGIDSVTLNGTMPSHVNLQGQRVGNDYHGIIIVNGKKYIQR